MNIEEIKHLKHNSTIQNNNTKIIDQKIFELIKETMKKKRRIDLDSLYEDLNEMYEIELIKHNN